MAQATGNVVSFDNNSTDPTIIYYGTVKDPEMNEVLNVTDPGFTSSNFTIGDLVSYGISSDEDSEGNFTAFGVKPASKGNIQTINSSSSADINTAPGDIITVTGKGTVVSGNISINGGKVIVDDHAAITPAGSNTIVVAGNGIMVARGNGSVNGSVVVNTGGSMKVVNKGTVIGSVVATQAGRLMIGNDNGTGSITGTIDIKKIRSFDITAGSTITGK